jgi:hypothetical protein
MEVSEKAKNASYNFYIIDVFDSLGNPMWSDVGKGENNLASTDTGLLFFQKSGVYKLKICVWGDCGQYEIQEILIPVEEA